MYRVCVQVRVCVITQHPACEHKLVLNIFDSNPLFFLWNVAAISQTCGDLTFMRLTEVLLVKSLQIGGHLGSSPRRLFAVIQDQAYKSCSNGERPRYQKRIDEVSACQKIWSK